MLGVELVVGGAEGVAIVGLGAARDCASLNDLAAFFTDSRMPAKWPIFANTRKNMISM